MTEILKICEGVNFTGMDMPNIEAEQYRHCNFSFPHALDDKGVKKGHPLNIKATLVLCNCVNRELGPDVVAVNCNSAIRDCDVEFSETQESDNIYGWFDAETRKYQYYETPIITNVRTKPE